MAWCYKPIRSAWSFGKHFAPKIREIGQKQGFLNYLKNLVMNVFLICSTMKVYIICFGPAQIPYLGKYGPRDMDQSAFGQSDCRIFRSSICLEQNDEIIHGN